MFFSVFSVQCLGFITVFQGLVFFSVFFSVFQGLGFFSVFYGLEFFIVF